MAHRHSNRLAPWIVGAALVAAVASPAAAASCAQVDQLISNGLSIDQVAAAVGAPVGMVQACLQARAGAAGPAPFGAAGPPPLGAAGPPPFGAAGPPPLGAAGPAPLGAAGPPPLGAAGPAPIGSNAIKKR